MFKFKVLICCNLLRDKTVEGCINQWQDDLLLGKCHVVPLLGILGVAKFWLLHAKEIKDMKKIA